MAKFIFIKEYQITKTNDLQTNPIIEIVKSFNVGDVIEGTKKEIEVWSSPSKTYVETIINSQTYNIPVDVLKESDTNKSGNGWMIAVGIVLIVIAVVLILKYKKLI